MSKKAFIVFMAVLVGIVVPSFNNSVGAYSTTVRYSSPGSSYYELIVPLVMAPGETATVSAVGTWNSQTALEVTADENVTLICDALDVSVVFLLSDEKDVTKICLDEIYRCLFILDEDVSKHLKDYIELCLNLDNKFKRLKHSKNLDFDWF